MFEKSPLLVKDDRRGAKVSDRGFNAGSMRPEMSVVLCAEKETD